MKLEEYIAFKDIAEKNKNILWKCSLKGDAVLLQDDIILISDEVPAVSASCYWT